MLECKHVQDIVTLNICVKLYQNRSINEGTKAMTTFSSENRNCDLDPDRDPKILEYKCVQYIVILQICVKLYQN